MTDRLKGRVAIVTGGGQGIGRAIVERFAGEGASIIVNTRSAGPGEEVVARISASGGVAALHLGDVGCEETCAQLVQVAIERFGTLDIIVHNAAFVRLGMLQHTSAANLDRTLDLNLKAAFWLARSGLAHLEKSVAARLLFVSSIVGNRQAHTGFASYGASKAGLNGFIRQAAIELAAKKIRVNGVEPGATLTERVRSGLSEERLKTITAAIPLGRTASPDDVAAAVLFLASDDACHITGQTIVVDGGQSLGMALPGN